MTRIIPKTGATMTSQDISDLVESRHDSVKRTIERLADRGVIARPPLVDGAKAANNVVEKVYVFSDEKGKRDSYIVVAQLCPEFTARLVDRWQELEQSLILQKPAQFEKLPGELAILECYSKLLNPAPSCRIAMLQKVGERHGLDVTFLPGYAIDAAPDATAGSSMPTASLTSLLAEHGINLSTSVYNTILRDMGMIEARTRRSSKGGQKSFWVVTEAGQEYGKNLTSPASPRETQPHWYTERFPALHAAVSQRMGRAA